MVVFDMFFFREAVIFKLFKLWLQNEYKLSFRCGKDL